MNKDNKNLYQCPICGFHYENKEWAEKCEAFCRAHNGCSLEITKYAVENQQ